MASDNITSIKSKRGNLTWINIINPQRDEIDYLAKRYKFSELDLKDTHMKRIAERPKFHQRRDYSFLILQFPIYNKKSRTIEAEEVNFFIGDNYIITAHKNNLPPLVELFNMCNNDGFYSEQYLASGNLALLYEMINRLQEYCYPLLDHTSSDFRNMEKNIFGGMERAMVKEILLVKRNILNFRKIMQAHHNVLFKLNKANVGGGKNSETNDYYSELIDHTKSIWDILDSQREMIEALEDTNQSLIQFKLNDIMRILTIVSVITMPISTLAVILAMHNAKSLPFTDNIFSFILVIAVMWVFALSVVVFFRRKKWL